MPAAQTALLVIAGLSEALKLGQELIDSVNRGEMTDEQAAEVWEKTRANWTQAYEGWKNTKAPGQ